MYNILTGVDRLMSKAGPFNRLLNGIVERVVPHQVAHAACCTHQCSSSTTSCPGGFRIVQVCALNASLCFFGEDTWTCTGACLN
jgi:hypothetical protein